LRLKSGFDFGNLFSAKLIFYPANHNFFSQISEWNQVVGAIKPKAAIGAGGIGAVIGSNGIMRNKNKTVFGLAFKISDCPGECSEP